MISSDIRMEELKLAIGKYFKVAIFGALICTVSSVLDIIMVSTDNETLSVLNDWFLIVGAIVWGAGLIGAGNIICKIGHAETGVVSAGGAMIFWALALIIYQIFAETENIDFRGTSFYVWTAITLIGPVIFYFALKQDEDNEDHFLGWAAYGMGAVILSELLFVGVILLLIWTSDGGGITYHHYKDYTIVEQSKYSVMGEWIGEHFKLVSIILTSVTTFGFILCLGCMANYKDFVDELQEIEKQKEKEKLIDGLLEKYEAEIANKNV